VRTLEGFGARAPVDEPSGVFLAGLLQQARVDHVYGLATGRHWVAIEANDDVHDEVRHVEGWQRDGV
jgi:hypothetical protein